MFEEIKTANNKGYITVVIQAAETGSGKTGAFCLPVLQIVWESLRDSMLGKTHKGTTCIGN